MSVKTRIYIGSIVALGAAALARGLPQWDLHDPIRFLCYLVLSVIASGLKVRLPGVTGTMSVSFLFLLVGIAELGLPSTLVMGAAGVLVQSFWHAKVRPRPVQLVFSVANVSIAVTAAHFVYSFPVVLLPYLQTPFRLAAAATAYFFANTFPIAVVIALTEGKPLRRVWTGCYWWSFPYYLVGAAFVGVFGFANRMLDWQAWLLILPVVYVLYRSYHLYLDQLQTEQKHAEEQRRHAGQVASLHARAMESLAAAVAANAKLEAVIQASPLAILALDLKGDVTSWNAMAERMFGWKAEEVLGKPLSFTGSATVGDESSRDLVKAIVERTTAGESLSGMEVKHWRRDESSLEAAIWTAPLRSPSGSISGVVVTVADLSDRKRLEEQLRRSQKMEAVGRLAGGVAHDFNNLLTVINGYSAMLAESTKQDAQARAQAHEILAAGTRAAALVSQLLAFSRHQVTRPHPLDINRLVQDVERMLLRLLGEHVVLDTMLDEDAGWILADSSQIETVLINLATNARDAMPEGGTLSIETARVDVVPGRQSVEPDLPAGCYACLVVTDTGRGMDAETQQHLFEPFFTTKEMGKGTGLGLSSVYAAVQKFGGRIFVKSELGAGARFSIYLPRCDRPTAEDPQRAASLKLSRGNETILLVEDEIAVRRMARDVLSSAGYRVCEAGNGAEALEHWRAELDRFDLLVTDVVMPRMNGVKLAEELQKRRPDLKVLFMSGHAEDMLAAHNCSAELSLNFLPKPFHPYMLAYKVRAVLDEALVDPVGLEPTSKGL